MEANEVSGSACHGCSRREFLNGSVIVAVSALLAACGDGVIGSGVASDIAGPVNLTVTLADYPALANVGGIARINGASTPVAVVRSAASTYLAFSMICTHQGTTININGSGFKCPNHLAQFNASGTWIGGQPTSNLRAFTATLDATGGTLVIT